MKKKNRRTMPPRGSRRTAWAAAKSTKREKFLMSAAADSLNIEDMNRSPLAMPKKEERKPPPKTWLARRSDTTYPCGRCNLPIEVGQRIHCRPSDGLLVHHAHAHVEPVVEVCSTCWMTRPCECDE